MQNRAAFSTAVWCASLLATTGFMAWKFGWLPIELTSPETGTLAKQEKPAEDAGGSTTERDNESPAETGDSESIIFAAQTEPGGEPDFGIRPGAGSERSETPGRDSVPEFDPTPVGRSMARGAGAGERVPGGRGMGNASFTPPRRDDRIEPASLEIDDRDLRRASPRPLPRGIPSDEFGSASVERPAPRRSPIVQVAGEIETVDEPVSAGDRLAAIDEAIAGGQYLAAHKELSRIYWKEPALRGTIQERIDRTAKVIYFSPQPHFMDPYTIEPGDQLRKVAGQYRVPWQYLARLNQVDPTRIRAGQKLKVIKGPFSAIVDLSDFELIVHAHGYYVKRYRVGIGKDGASPVGKFKVLDKVSNPQYTDPDGRVVDGDDPANPLGERWLNLGNSYGIHGTIEPNSIGKAESRGCVRMLNAEVEEVYDLLDVGSEVIIRP